MKAFVDVFEIQVGRQFFKDPIGDEQVLPSHMVVFLLLVMFSFFCMNFVKFLFEFYAVSLESQR